MGRASSSVWILAAATSAYQGYVCFSTDISVWRKHRPASVQPIPCRTLSQQFTTNGAQNRVSLLQAGKDLVARGGVRELYQGLGVTLVGSMPAVGVYFGLYQFVKKQMDARDSMSPYLSITVSAGVGNFVAR